MVVKGAVAAASPASISVSVRAERLDQRRGTCEPSVRGASARVKCDAFTPVLIECASECIERATGYLRAHTGTFTVGRARPCAEYAPT
jgi:hypothetical protein